jgi:hypothetical protein
MGGWSILIKYVRFMSERMSVLPARVGSGCIAITEWVTCDSGELLGSKTVQLQPPKPMLILRALQLCFETLSSGTGCRRRFSAIHRGIVVHARTFLLFRSVKRFLYQQLLDSISSSVIIIAIDYNSDGEPVPEYNWVRCSFIQQFICIQTRTIRAESSNVGFFFIETENRVSNKTNFT